MLNNGSRTVKLKYNKPDVEGLKAYLIDELNFNQERVEQSINRLLKKNNGINLTQKSLEDFFKVR